MARGWESKSVEAQMDARADRSGTTRAPVETPEQARRRQERASLELSRKRVLKDLENATNPRYREMLERALRHLDDKVREL